MGNKLESLISVCNSMRDYAIETPMAMFPMTIYIWIDTNQDTCKAITGQIHLEFSGDSRDTNCPMTNSKLFAMLMLIDRLTPIYKIVVEGHPFKAFIVSQTEEFMKKGCGS
jgi:hypothetical protein